MKVLVFGSTGMLGGGIVSHTRKMDTTLRQALVAFARLEQRRGPSARELMTALGLASSSNGAHWIERLAVAGLIQPVPGSDVYSPHRWQVSDAGFAALAEAGAAIVEST